MRDSPNGNYHIKFGKSCTNYMYYSYYWYRRAVHFKATETLLEAAPQLFLQFYIAYKRCPDDNSMCAFLFAYYYSIIIL